MIEIFDGGRFKSDGTVGATRDVAINPTLSPRSDVA